MLDRHELSRTADDAIRECIRFEILNEVHVSGRRRSLANVEIRLLHIKSIFRFHLP